MKRRIFVLAAVALVGLPAGAMAADITGPIVEQLRRQGYTEIEVGRTLLGRTRIAASSEGGRREIIFNPRTGEILRDYTEGDTAIVRIIETDTRGRRGDGDDDKDDDGKDDDKDDDDKDDDDKDDDDKDDDDKDDDQDDDGDDDDDDDDDDDKGS